MSPTITESATRSTPDSSDRVRLVALSVEGFKRIRAVRIRPDGSVVKITGKNGAGKSSILDAIEALLGGGRHAPDRPVRRGAKRATIEGSTNTGIQIRRSFSEGGAAQLEVLGEDGEPIKSPQAFLDRIIGSGLALDPMQFCRMEPRQQVEIIKRVAGLDDHLAQIEERRQKAQADKTAFSRDVKTLEMQLSGLPDIAGPDCVVSLADLSQQMSAAAEQKAKNDRARKGLADRRAELAGIADEVAALNKRLAELRDRATVLQGEIDQWGPTVVAMVDPDLDALRRKAATIEAENELARRRQARRDVLARLESANEAARRASRALEDITIEREDVIRAAKLPVPGLSFTEEGLTLNGQPFDQASTAEQIGASVALAMRQNTGLGVILCREGSLLDESSMRLLAELAETHGLQVWTEVVSNGGGDGVVIEDGEVKGGVA